MIIEDPKRRVVQLDYDTACRLQEVLEHDRHNGRTDLEASEYDKIGLELRSAISEPMDHGTYWLGDEEGWTIAGLRRVLDGLPRTRRIQESTVFLDGDPLTGLAHTGKKAESYNESQMYFLREEQVQLYFPGGQPAPGYTDDVLIAHSPQGVEAPSPTSRVTLSELRPEAYVPEDIGVKIPLSEDPETRLQQIEDRLYGVIIIPEATGAFGWQVYEQPTVSTGEMEKLLAKHGAPKTYLPPKELTIHTAYPHGQLKAPAPVVSRMTGPYQYPNDLSGLSRRDATFIAHSPADIAYLLPLAKRGIDDLAGRLAHPWYGPCDAFGPDGRCAECLKVAEVQSAAMMRHNVSGGRYRILGNAEAQCSTGPIEEGDTVTVYEGHDGRWWVRKDYEFRGRFSTEQDWQDKQQQDKGEQE